MPRGPLGAPRPLVESRTVIILLTEDKVGIDQDPAVIDRINRSLSDISIGPGFEATSIESLERGITDGMFSQTSLPDPVRAIDPDGLFLTFSYPYLSGDQIDEIQRAIDAEVDTGLKGYFIGCL